MTARPPTPPPFCAIPEPKDDAYTCYPRDPRLELSVYQIKKKQKASQIRRDIERHFRKYQDDESFFDALRTFKNQETQQIIDSLESQPIHNRQRILEALSDLADNILFAAYQRVFQRLRGKYGAPGFLSSYKQTGETPLAIVGMGKLGGREINYQSDLDLIFVYAHKGETLGAPPVDNGQFFIKLAQQLMNTLSVMTATGRCYQVDTELRPSGNAGTLVT
ncbi:MAG TPA: hypothetical protein VJC18_05620, partial [bacterium]|nr:hypothetical protein [bacterium]